MCTLSAKPRRTLVHKGYVHCYQVPLVRTKTGSLAMFKFRELLGRTTYISTFLSITTIFLCSMCVFSHTTVPFIIALKLLEISFFSIELSCNKQFSRNIFIWQDKNCVHHSVIHGNLGQYNMYPS
jgi:hypothetical protein